MKLKIDNRIVDIGKPERSRYCKEVLEQRKKELMDTLRDFFLLGGVYKPAEILIDLYQANLTAYSELEKLYEKGVFADSGLDIPKLAMISSDFTVIGEYLKMIIEMGEKVGMITKIEESISEFE